MGNISTQLGIAVDAIKWLEAVAQSALNENKSVDAKRVLTMCKTTLERISRQKER